MHISNILNIRTQIYMLVNIFRNGNHPQIPTCKKIRLNILHFTLKTVKECVKRKRRIEEIYDERGLNRKSTLNWLSDAVQMSDITVRFVDVDQIILKTFMLMINKI